MTDSIELPMLIINTSSDTHLTVIKHRDEFFRNAIDRLSIPRNSGVVRVEVSRLGGQADYTPPSSELAEYYWAQSDDYIHRLLVFDELIAMVMDRRNEGNIHEVTFWKREATIATRQLLIETFLDDQ